jgi:hypothetical protein
MAGPWQATSFYLRLFSRAVSDLRAFVLSWENGVVL